MNKDLHNMDDAFNWAYQRLEEEPSVDAWEKINATLDKKDAEKYKRKFIGWKRISFLLLLLLTGILIYETGILKTNSFHSNQNTLAKKDAKEILGIIPDARDKQYDMHEVIARLIDDSDFDR